MIEVGIDIHSNKLTFSDLHIAFDWLEPRAPISH
jgi:hypothetical protein